MLKVINRCLTRLVAASLVLFLGLTILGPFGLQACAPSLLNDRAAQIINVTPFTPGHYIISGDLSGKGQLIGLADSGLDKGQLEELHPDLAGETADKPRIGKLESVSGRLLPDDPDGHGTHMAGILIGSGEASQGKYKGIAPAASLYFQALLDQQGSLRVPSQVSDLYKPAYLAGVRVYVNGWGNNGNAYQESSRQIDDFVAEHPDFLPIFGAGNSGPGPNSLTAEANSKNALVVGASQSPRPALDMDLCQAEQKLPSSSRGPAVANRIKPELLAPGSNIISICSSLQRGNFTPNPSYTAKSGTSMAAAVTGGAVALLREYLQTYRHLDEPSAALIKALLINGARNPAGTPDFTAGFGILDLAGTILPVQDKTVEYVNQANISAGQTREFHINIEKPGALFKATLAWTDPPAAALDTTILRNDLDLVVKDPNGRLYRGNDFKHSGQADVSNNVEQVLIPNALAGIYTVSVNATRFDPDFTQQAFALVYGEAMEHDTVVSDSEGKLLLGGARSHSGALAYDQSSRLAPGQAVDSHVGAELYWHSQKAYLLLQSWQKPGVQMLAAPQGHLIVEANPLGREGGYFLIPQGISTQISVNGESIDNSNDFPNGAYIQATINPIYQMLWQVKAQATAVEGYIRQVDAAQGRIWLIKDEEPYQIYPAAAINVKNDLTDSMFAALPYGFASSIDLYGLEPGMKVQMQLTPSTRSVNHITVQRQVIIGTAVEVLPQDESVELNNGTTYRLFPGARVFKDGMATGLGDIAAGDYVVGLPLPGSSRWLQLDAFSQVAYGRVIYFNEDEQRLYIFNSDNQIQECRLTAKTLAYRRDLLMPQPSFEPGSWVRVLMSAPDQTVLRLDVAETSLWFAEKTLLKYDPFNHMFTMTDGSMYQWLPSTLVSSGGYAVKPEDMIAGRPVWITTLRGDAVRSCLAAIEAYSDSKAPPPVIHARAAVLNGTLILQGETDADQVAVYRRDGSRTAIQPDPGGYFSLLQLEDAAESWLRIVAIDKTNGAVISKDIAIETYQPPASASMGFKDIEESAAREEILSLAEAGILSGYDNGFFRPYAAINRLELVGLLCHVLELSPQGGPIQTRFADQAEIPWWGIGMVQVATEKGLIEGYDDNTFRPLAPVSRAEMALIIDRSYAIVNQSRPGQPLISPPDIPTAPVWAQAAVNRGYERDSWPIDWQSAFKPHNFVTREEAVLIVAGLLNPS